MFCKTVITFPALLRDWLSKGLQNKLIKNIPLKKLQRFVTVSDMSECGHDVDIRAAQYRCPEFTVSAVLNC
jgi:hypothetical protein